MSKISGMQEAKTYLKASTGKVSIFNLNKLTKLGLKTPERLPFSIKVLLESALRNYDNYQVTKRDVENTGRLVTNQ